MTVLDAPTLFDPDRQVEAPETLEERAARWIAANPEPVRQFAEVALAMHRAGERIGAKAIAEHLRVDRVVTDRCGDRWLWNNSYTSHVARYVMERWPELDGYFETRSRS